MLKNKNRTESFTRRQTSVLPQISNMDVLSYMLDENLTMRLPSLEEGREKALTSGYDPAPWEVEIAYIRREQQIRRGRRLAHDHYLRNTEEECVWSEANLPVADLDNSKFLELN